MSGLNTEARRPILVVRHHKYMVAGIRQRLLEEHISISLVDIYDMIKKYQQQNTVVDRPRRPWKLVTSSLVDNA